MSKFTIIKWQQGGFVFCKSHIPGDITIFCSNNVPQKRFSSFLQKAKGFYDFLDVRFSAVFRNDSICFFQNFFIGKFSIDKRGWDAEDFYGPMKIYQKLEKNDQTNINRLVVGPWRHGGWARGKGDSLWAIGFGSNTSEYYRSNIQAPWFSHHLKGNNSQNFPEAHVFITGLNQWKSFKTWPPLSETKPTNFYFRPDNSITMNLPFDKEGTESLSYVSDPNNPVPYSKRPIKGFKKSRAKIS